VCYFGDHAQEDVLNPCLENPHPWDTVGIIPELEGWRTTDAGNS
jgi:hypothetical protein